MISSLTSIANNFQSFFVMLHLFAMVLVLGGATYSDMLLMKFLKDYKISPKEAEVIKTMAQAILMGIILAFFSGLMLFLPSTEHLLSTPKFLVKCVIFIVALINGFLLHHLILPKLIHFSFHKEVYLSKKFHLRQAGFIAGAISVVSWYSIFILGCFKSWPFSFGQMMLGYLAILFGAIASALYLERYLSRKAKA